MMNKSIIATEHFQDGKTNYFFDFKQAVNGRYYLHIARSDRQEDDSYQRSGVVIFEDNFELTIQALSQLFTAARYQVETSALNRLKFADKEPGGIKGWEPELRPREKLMEQGRARMEDAELVAMLIGSGSRRESAVDLARRILASVDDDLQRLAELTVDELCRFPGVGIAKALSIISSMELAARLQERVNNRIWMKAL
jgi:DNA repair protein RadC